MDKVIQEWDGAAKAYTEFQGVSRYQIFCQEFVHERFANVQNKKILDAGCGNGIYTHILTQNGGDVTGCDASAEMLDIAKAAYPSYRFDYANLHEPLPYLDEELDIVLCSLVSMDIDPIDNLISESHRILKENGIFFFSVVHPAFYLADWEKNEQGVVVSKKVTGYITPKVERQSWQGFEGTTAHYHRPISFYFNKIADAGFALARMYEPKVYEETKIPDIPLFLFAEFIKSDHNHPGASRHPSKEGNKYHKERKP